MPTSLREWRTRLDAHFRELASARAEARLPLFALEHGLTGPEVADIAELLESYPAEDVALGLDWLVWIVHATEIGYQYDGDKYWPPFTERAGQWRDVNTRHRLREWFERFRTRYQGVTPTGPWAGHFRVIAWPITHAILPRYLQEQFAKTLFALRYQLAHLEEPTAAAAGRLIASSAWDASSRFREFLQQEELAGRIVLALLRDGDITDPGPIYGPTLQRIVADLEQVRNARDWLNDTRRVVADRFRGASVVRPSGSTATVSRERQSDGGSLPDLQTKLMLRRSATDAWSVILDLPSLASVMPRFPELQPIVRATRCKVAGMTGSWLPAGWLLAGPQRRLLRTWPGPGTPLLVFEHSNAAINRAFGSALCLSQGPIWPCRVGSDGLAREITMRVVRPGQQYVLLSETPIPKDYAAISECQVDCVGVAAAVLTVPETLSSADINAIQRLRLQPARTIRIWPAGLCARDWDGEGTSEWLTSETPCFGIAHDHPLSALTVRLNGGPETIIPSPRVGVPAYVRLSPLAPGTHRLIVKARRDVRTSGSFGPPNTIEGLVTLRVREPSAWIPGTTLHSGLAVLLDPPEPSLDTLWDGNLAVRVIGPAGAQVTCGIILSDARGKQLLAEQFGPYELPLTTDTWRRAASTVLSNEANAWPFLEASSGQLLIKGDELGDIAVRLDRDVTPLRWLCHRERGVMTVRLLDETGGEEDTAVRFYGFGRPAAGSPHDARKALDGFQVMPPGGLYEATNGESNDWLVVSTPQIQGGLQGLAVNADLRDIVGVNVPISRVLELLHVWFMARSVGPLAGVRRLRVVNKILLHLYARLCGRKWGDTEHAVLESAGSDTSIQELQRLVGSHGFAVLLRRDYVRMETSVLDGATWFAEAAARYQVCSDRDLCDLALQLASRPHTLIALPASDLTSRLDDLRANGVLLRAARFVAVVAAMRGPDTTGIALPRWTW